MRTFIKICLNCQLFVLLGNFVLHENTSIHVVPSTEDLILTCVKFYNIVTAFIILLAIVHFKWFRISQWFQKFPKYCEPFFYSMSFFFFKQQKRLISLLFLLVKTEKLLKKSSQYFLEPLRNS